MLILMEELNNFSKDKTNFVDMLVQSKQFMNQENPDFTEQDAKDMFYERSSIDNAKEKLKELNKEM